MEAIKTEILKKGLLQLHKMIIHGQEEKSNIKNQNGKLLIICGESENNGNGILKNFAMTDYIIKICNGNRKSGTRR